MCQSLQKVHLTGTGPLGVVLTAAEIARLQHSIGKLKETQQLLAEEVKADPDPELQTAFEENADVM